MQRNLFAVVRSIVCLTLAVGVLAHAEDKKTNPTGTWKWTVEGRDGTPRESTLTLKLDGDKLTGSMTGRRGDTAITNGVFKGDEVSFEVVREFNEMKLISKYNGKLSGDTIKGKIETQRDGETQSRDWEAKREGAKPAAETKPKDEAKPAASNP
jgi:hypothetical protein